MYIVNLLDLNVLDRNMEHSEMFANEKEEICSCDVYTWRPTVKKSPINLIELRVEFVP
jgi:hypothetical protein